MPIRCVCGDLVLSRDERTGEQGYKRVVRLFRGHTDQVVYLRIAKAAATQRGRSERHRVGQEKGGSSSDGEDGSDPDPDSSQQIRCTTEHPFWVQGQGWTAAKDLRPGDQLLGSQGEQLVVRAHEVRQEEADHYNFAVEDWHTYFVSETEQDPAVWVHNTCEPVIGGKTLRTGTKGELKSAGAKDGHHIIQDAAVRDVPGYSYSKAPSIELPGPSTKIGSPHYKATQVQRQRGGGTYGAERRIAYKALRKAGLTPKAARAQIDRADAHLGLPAIGIDTLRPRHANLTEAAGPNDRA